MDQQSRRDGTRLRRHPGAAARERIAEAKALRPYYLGDYYPLLDIVLDEQV